MKKQPVRRRRNRAAQDATLVNVRAMRKEIGSLKARVTLLMSHLVVLRKRVAALEGK